MSKHTSNLYYAKRSNQTKQQEVYEGPRLLSPDECAHRLNKYAERTKELSERMEKEIAFISRTVASRINSELLAAAKAAALQVERYRRVLDANGAEGVTEAEYVRDQLQDAIRKTEE